MLIAVAVLSVLHGFWLAPRLTNQHVDLLAQWYPRWCYLGRSLRSGHIPTWLPYQFGGYPFASDPQSGWLYAPVMLLFPFVSCSRALGLVVISHPLIAGLGLYLFLRNEGVGRPAATIGGLTLSLSMAASVMVLTMPFAATLAWTSVALAGASGLLRAHAWSRGLAWLAVAAFGVAQVATAHLSNGLVMAALVLSLYLVATVAMQVRVDRRSLPAAVGRGVLLVAPLPFLAAAVLIPRLAYLPRTSLGHGYVRLARIASRLSGQRVRAPLASHGESVWWGTSFARGPAGYVGVLALTLVVAAFTARLWRYPAAAFAVVGFVAWLLNLDVLIRAPAVRSFALKTGLGELWLRDPHRFRYLLLLSFGALAGYGTQAWLDHDTARNTRAILRRATWLAAPVAVFMAWPILAGSPKRPYVLFVIGLAVALPLLFGIAAGRSNLVAALPLLVAVELTVAGVVPQLPRGSSGILGARPSPDARFDTSFGALRSPSIDRHSYMTPGAIGHQLIETKKDFGRYLTFDPPIARQPRGFLLHQDPDNWAAYENGRSVLFAINETQGYLPVQVDRYWRLVRKINPVPIYYNAATFQVDPPNLLRLFGVEWVITASGVDPPAGATETANEGRYTLYRLPDAEGKASVVYEWRVLRPDAALSSVVQSGFDPAREAVVERTPMLGRTDLRPGPLPHGEATYAETTPEHVVVRVNGNSDGLVVVRNVNDRNWHATVDGRPAEVLAADYLMQAIAVPAGSHVVELKYRDNAIGIGLLASATGWAMLLSALAIMLIVDRRNVGRNAPTAKATTQPEPVERQ